MLLFVQLCIHVHMYTRYSHLKRKSLAIYDTAHSDCKRSLQSPSHLHTSHMCPRHSSCRYFSTWLILNQIESLIRTWTSSPYPVKNASPSCHWSFVVLVSNWRPLPHRGLKLLFLASLYCDSHLLLFSSFRESTITGFTNVWVLREVIAIWPISVGYALFHCTSGIVLPNIGIFKVMSRSYTCTIGVVLTTTLSKRIHRK